MHPPASLPVLTAPLALPFLVSPRTRTSSACVALYSILLLDPPACLTFPRLSVSPTDTGRRELRFSFRLPHARPRARPPLSSHRPRRRRRNRDPRDAICRRCPFYCTATSNPRLSLSPRPVSRLSTSCVSPRSSSHLVVALVAASPRPRCRYLHHRATPTPSPPLRSPRPVIPPRASCAPSARPETRAGRSRRRRSRVAPLPQRPRARASAPAPPGIQPSPSRTTFFFLARRRCSEPQDVRRPLGSVSVVVHLTCAALPRPRAVN